MRRSDDARVRLLFAALDDGGVGRGVDLHAVLEILDEHAGALGVAEVMRAEGEQRARVGVQTVAVLPEIVESFRLKLGCARPAVSIA